MPQPDAESPRPVFRVVSALDLLRNFSRDPFREALSRWLENGPSPEEIQAQAKKNPDRWAQGASMLSKMAGYSERMELDVTGEMHHVHQLSDLELQSELADLDRQLASLQPTAIPATTGTLVKSLDPRHPGETDAAGPRWPSALAKPGPG